MTVYNVMVWRPGQPKDTPLNITLQSYRKAYSALVEYVATIDVGDYYFTIVRVKGDDRKEVAHGSITGGRKI